MLDIIIVLPLVFRTWQSLKFNLCQWLVKTGMLQEKQYHGIAMYYRATQRVF